MLRSLAIRAFTLVELLIVVVVLGILAGIVLPSFSSSTQDTKVSATVQNVQTIRSALDFFKVQHSDTYPGYPTGGSGTPTEALFTAQLTLASKKDGSTAAIGTAGYTYGPYLKNGIPANPFNAFATVKIIADGAAFPTAGDDTTGWVYKPQTGEFKANTAAQTEDGQDVFDF
jgi:prepilin-type N-terminal cleavage/methylation domain-containing protein